MAGRNLRGLGVVEPGASTLPAVSRLLQLGLVAVLAVIIVAGAVLLSSRGGDDPPAPSSAAGGGGPGAEVAALYEGIPQDGVRLGNPDAPVTLVEFADLQCPFCAQYSTQVLPSLVEDYVRTGRVNYELRIRAFLGRDSVRASGAAAHAAEQDRLFQFADLFYRDQGPENSGYVDDAFVRDLASRVEGLDPEAAVAAADDPLRYPLVRRGEVLAQRFRSTGTPDFYVRGEDGSLAPLGAEGTGVADYAAALDRALAGR